MAKEDIKFIEWKQTKGRTFWKRAEESGNAEGYALAAFLKSQGIMTAEEGKNFISRKISIAEFEGEKYPVDLVHTSEFRKINGIAYISLRSGLFVVAKEALKNDEFAIYKQEAENMVKIGEAKMVVRTK